MGEQFTKIKLEKDSSKYFNYYCFCSPICLFFQIILRINAIRSRLSLTVSFNTTFRVSPNGKSSRLPNLSSSCSPWWPYEPVSMETRTQLLHGASKTISPAAALLLLLLLRWIPSKFTTNRYMFGINEQYWLVLTSWRDVLTKLCECCWSGAVSCFCFSLETRSFSRITIFKQ